MTAEFSQLAPLYAEIALANIAREYPHHLSLTLEHEDDLLEPHAMHPAFYGSYDWHSSVHMHWLLTRLLRLFPKVPQASGICQAFDAHFTTANIAAEARFLQRPSNRTFERTYGWAWLLKLQTEMHILAEAHAGAAIWLNALQLLANLITERYLEFLPLAEFPIRAGTHANSAFGLLFALEYAECMEHRSLNHLISAKAQAWFGSDRLYPATFEPGGDDFLSAGLMEAALMARILDTRNFTQWWQAFSPPQPELQIWLMPVSVSAPDDPKLAHLDGLNLSRAWCWQMLMDKMPVALQPSITAAINAHLAASLPQALSGTYAGTHWLASFALLAMTAPL